VPITRWLTVHLLALCTAIPLSAQAQDTQAEKDWPSKAIRWVVPYAPGGPADVVSRIIAAKLGDRLGRSVIVDNRPGASGNIGAELVAKAAPDGYTLLYVNPFLVTNPLYMKGATDYVKDLAPVINMTAASMVLVTHPSVAARSVPELIALVKRNPGAVSCASSGALPSVGCELIQHEAKAKLIIVTYKGQAPALNAVISGEVNFGFDMNNTVAPYVKAQRVRAIASTTDKRRPFLGTELPTLSESIPDSELVSWQGLMAPAATPAPIIARLNREIGAILAQPEMRQQLLTSGLEVLGGSPEAFGELLKQERARFIAIFQKAGIKPE
jgi:tripartite-type tricarboxylate transporter receptor subunit TctC